MDFLINSAYAQAAGATGGGPSLLNTLLLPALLLVVFYFLLIRPQSKRAKDQREMLSKIAAEEMWHLQDTKVRELKPRLKGRYVRCGCDVANRRVSAVV